MPALKISAFPRVSKTLPRHRGLPSLTMEVARR
jgi:hypothetical protein